MELPQGYSDVKRGPHCGVLAVAICANVPFQTAFDYIKKHGKRSNKWRGGTYPNEQLKALEHFGVRFWAKRLTKPVTVSHFAEWLARRNVVYILATHNHVMTLHNGMLADQSGIVLVGEHKCRKRRVERYVMIVSKRTLPIELPSPLAQEPEAIPAPVAVKPAASPKPKRNVVAERKAKVDAAIKRWESKLKRAQNALRKLRIKQRYYQRKES